MSTSAEGVLDLDMSCDLEGRGSAAYSPASSYSTYSHEVKYIFNPVHEEGVEGDGEEGDEYSDYSHIVPRAKHSNYLAYTPRTLSATSQLSGKENQTPYAAPHPHPHPPNHLHPHLHHHPPPSRDEPGMMSYELQHPSLSRTCSVTSNTSRDRGPISPHLEEALYSSSSLYSHSPRKPEVPHPSERNYFSPASGDYPQNPYAKHGGYSQWKNSASGNINNSNSNSINNKNNNSHNNAMTPAGGTLGSGGPKSLHSSTFQQDIYRRSSGGGGGGGSHLPQNPYPLNNVHNYNHYQQPQHHQQQQHHHHHQQQQQQQQHYAHNPLPVEQPPYPPPPRYSYQQHSRRKTWSPPALKMSLLNSGYHGNRVCHSHDSLDCTEEVAAPGGERKAMSMSDDLDVTPPKLAPISGVLAQKPGPNLIKPVAFKPHTRSPPCSPGSQQQQQQRRRQVSGEELSSSAGGSPHDMTRPAPAVKLGTGMLGIRASPDSHGGKANRGAFNATKPAPHPGNVPAGGAMHAPGSSHQASPGLTSIHHSSYPAAGPQGHIQHNSSGSCNLNASSSSSSSYQNVFANSQNNFSANSSHLSGAEEASSSAEVPRASDRPDSVPSISTTRLSSQRVESMLQTPSPSDSGVGELEAMLREKDAEINTLREVMDRNERAIFQVYEERKSAWLQDSQDLRDDYERKLKVQSRKSYKTEQVLSLQVYKLQQEQKTLQEEKAKYVTELDALKKQLEDNQTEISELKANLETAVSGPETRAVLDSANRDSDSLLEELALKNKEVITLKSQLQTFESDVEKKNKELGDKVRDMCGKNEEIAHLKEELARLKNPLVTVETSTQTHVPSEVAELENVKPSVLGERERTISDLQEELQQLKEEVVGLKEEHSHEREQWLDEKNKVVRYQKQLQLNYVQMQRKNSTLETEVQQLTLELENRDMKLIALNGEESVC